MLLTPPLGLILAGISRMSVLEIARTVGIPVREEALRLADLDEADEIFTAHSGVKVHPVARFAERELAAPGPLTKQLLQLVDDTLNFRDARFAHFFQNL